MDLRRRLYLYIPLALVALLQNLVHEGLHFLFAVLAGEGVQEFRFLTNGFLTSQVVYAAPVDTRTGAHWVWIALGPSVVTTMIGLIVYSLRGKLLTRWSPVNLIIWYVGALFMTIDPLYLGLLSWFMQGSDANVMSMVGLPIWLVRIPALVISVLTVWLVLRWRAEARQDVGRYALASPTPTGD